MSRIVRRLAARRDLMDHYRYLARAAGYRSADRFFGQLETTLEQLSRTPGIGARYEAEHPGLGELRIQTVSRFKSYLIFYRPLSDGIEVVRVLHGARDIHSILAEDLGLDMESQEDAGDDS